MLGDLDKKLYYGMIIGAGMVENRRKFILYANTSKKDNSYKPEARLIGGRIKGVGIFYNTSPFPQNPIISKRPCGGGILVNSKKGLAIVSNGLDVKEIYDYYIKHSDRKNEFIDVLRMQAVSHDVAWTINMAAWLLNDNYFATFNISGLCTSKLDFDYDPEDWIDRRRNQVCGKIEFSPEEIKAVTTYQGMKISSGLRKTPERENLEDVIHSIPFAPYGRKIKSAYSLAEWFSGKLNQELDISIVAALWTNSYWDLGFCNGGKNPAH